MENVNSVAYVTKITEILPIEGADKIEQVFAGGWSCVAQKDKHKVGDFVIVATTDAVIPEDLAEELQVISYLRKGNRVRTVKLKGVYSECLIIPFQYANISTKNKLVEGSDCMDILDIIKYEPPVKQITLSSGRKVKYHENPNFGVYYKFPNIKNVPEMFTEDNIVEVTRKIHGTNARYGIVKKKKLSLIDRIKLFFGNPWIEYEFVYGSHNVEKGSDSQGYYSTDVWKEIAEKYNIKERLWEYVKSFDFHPELLGNGVILYGEIYGKGIQKGYEYGLDEILFNGFDVKVNDQYISTEEAFNVITSDLTLEYVPILYVGYWNDKLSDRFVKDNFIDKSKVPHEGIVIKHITGERNKIAKIINPSYLIYSEKNNIGDSH
jgi:RNA ligase (TIGR02306 family)